MKQLLVIDDDTRLRNLLGQFLQENGFLVDLAKDTNEARNMISIKKYDLLIVDVMMPNENGIDFTSSIKQQQNIAILILTARGEPDDRIKGLEVGADDYLQKPFEPKELMLRINNILRRNKKVDATDTTNFEECVFGNLIFNSQKSRLTKNGEFIHLTESEAKILAILCKRKGEPISRDNLSEMCGNVDPRTIDVQITRLRRKIEENPKQPQFLQTVRNQGYILHG